MRYLIACIAVCVVILLYACIGASLNWQHGGGYLLMAGLFFAIVTLWKVITRPASQTHAESNSACPHKQDDTAMPVKQHVEQSPFAGFQEIPSVPEQKHSHCPQLVDKCP